jgi:hypothetical protein
LEQRLLTKSWQEARPGVQVKLLPEDGELYVLAESADRMAKERAIRRRQLKWLWARLKQISTVQPQARRVVDEARRRPLARAKGTTADRKVMPHSATGSIEPGLTPRSMLDKFAALQMIDVHIPITDGRELLLTRYTEPEKELNLLLAKLKLVLPQEPPPKITAIEAVPATPV